MNIFLAGEEVSLVFDALPDGVESNRADAEAVLRDGQVRLMWEDTPVDLFFNNLPFHETVAQGVKEVPFEDRHIPVLDGRSLIIFKAMFDRTKDWADIEAIVDWSPDEARRGAELLAGLVGEEDRACRRLAELLDG